MSDDPVDVLARTIWGEARGCGTAGMQHVANVIVNRANHPAWWGSDIVSVCTQPWQFSCRNPGNPNRAKLLAVTAADPEFATALAIARQAVEGALPDRTQAADSYYAMSMKTPPRWAAKSVRTTVDGWHAFYRTTTAAPPGTSPDVPNLSVHAATRTDADRLMDAELAAIHPPEQST